MRSREHLLGIGIAPVTHAGTVTPPRVEVAGMPVDVMSLSEAVARIVALARESTPSVVVTLGAEMVVCAQRDAAFARVVRAAKLVLPDTAGVVWACRLAGAREAHRVAGVDLIDPLCAALAMEGLPVFVLGGRGETAAQATAVLKSRFPALRIAGSHHGYFAPADEPDVVAAIGRSGASVLLAGLGSPRQELWLADRLEASGARVGIGIGGSLDVLAGNVARAPAIWQRLNLEWLYRLVREPWRWRRQLALPRFVAIVLRARWARRSTEPVP